MIRYQPGDEVVRSDYYSESILTVVRDSGGRYVDCVDNASGVGMSQARHLIRRVDYWDLLKQVPQS